MNIPESTTEPKEEISRPHPKSPENGSQDEPRFVAPDPRDTAKRAVKAMYRDINRLEEQFADYKAQIRWKIDVLALVVAAIVIFLALFTSFQ